MSDTRLRVFFAVAKHLSFTRAAEELNLTQPAITFQIKQLEEQFNTRLFDRHHNRITLTEAGQVVLDHVEQILLLYQRMEKAVDEMTGKIAGSLLLGASTTIGHYLLPQMLGRFTRDFGDVRPQVTVGNTERIVHLVEDNTIDLGIVEGPVQNRNLLIEPCMTDEMVVIFPPDYPWARRHEIAIEELTRYPFVSREEGSGSRRVIENYLTSIGIQYKKDLNIVLELGSSEAIKSAVEGGLGFSIVSRATILKEIDLGTLLEGRIEGYRLLRKFSFVYQKQKFKSRAAELFLTFCKKQCGEQDNPDGIPHQMMG